MDEWNTAVARAQGLRDKAERGELVTRNCVGCLRSCEGKSREPL